ncbi:Rieske (2Fe-2S) protein [Actinobacteria bacterium YIM 96077]|uniref:Cytochrome bc1 complex Rieske iron-sulfur subunit n=2 Tax=Phytoactinopolyspora halophila TaxID=1981511 RepID=A0A329QG24_9ACTN|nr:Rieske (2Fe-2S) protein [Actinobacteria bacterium YIM 96077]RAW11270.1 ubiquinol-cytochrome C reductase [Phytoactinopolyspora halophila]
MTYPAEHSEHTGEVERRAADGDPIPDPGLHEPPPRYTDVDPSANKRAERQVVGMFTLASVFIVASIVAYVLFEIEPSEGVSNVGDVQVSNFALGITLGLALLLIGIGAVHWSRSLMTSPEFAEKRKPLTSSEDVRQDTLASFNTGAHETGFGRRKMIRNSMFGALALLPLPAVVLLRDLGPLPGDSKEHTVWDEGVRLLSDVTYEPIRAADVDLGQLINVMPETFRELPEHGPERLNERAKSPVMLVRMLPEELSPAQGRENWHIDGIIAYSKICTHTGCPISLYERTTHHMLCPCHQSTFDLADNGKVIFGPATRNLPQLPLAVDDQGYLIAQSDFTEPVGPTYWERGTR